MIIRVSTCTFSCSQMLNRHICRFHFHDTNFSITLNSVFQIHFLHNINFFVCCILWTEVGIQTPAALPEDQGVSVAGGTHGVFHGPGGGGGGKALSNQKGK